MSAYQQNHENGLNEARNLLNQKSVEDLLKLSNNEDELAKLVNNLNEVQQLESTKYSLKENVRRLAIRNLDREPILSDEKQKLEALYSKLQRTQEEYKSIRQSYEELTAEMNPEMIWVLMQTAASELENTTEESAYDFFCGQRTEEEVNDFERRFIEDRKRAHELKIKAEKFQELMLRAPQGSFSSFR